ncbi:S24 family peptidase [Cronobacter turicensis]
MISAGFPGPAADYIDSGIDLVSPLIAHPSFTYVLRVASDSMRDADILDVSLLLVDFSLHAKHNDISVISVTGSVHRLRLTGLLIVLTAHKSGRKLCMGYDAGLPANFYEQ